MYMNAFLLSLIHYPIIHYPLSLIPYPLSLIPYPLSSLSYFKCLKSKLTIKNFTFEILNIVIIMGFDGS